MVAKKTAIMLYPNLAFQIYNIDASNVSKDCHLAMHTYHFNASAHQQLDFINHAYQSIKNDDLIEQTNIGMPDWIKKPSWFHSIDFGDGLKSCGRFFAKEQLANYTLYGVFDFLAEIDVDDMTCMDIGTMDGITAFSLKQLGAKTVIATDMSPRKTFENAKEHLALDIDYYPEIRIDDIPALLNTQYGNQKLDLIVNAGILYHVFDPLNSLITCRNMLKKDGLLILETMYTFDEFRPVMLFNPADNTPRGNWHNNTFWRSSKTTIEGMLNLASFDVLATRAINGRLTLLAQAKSPESVQTSYPKISNIIKSYMAYKNYGENIDYKQLKQDKSERSKISYTGKRTDGFIFRSLYATKLPLQPKCNLSRAQRLALLQEDVTFFIRTCIARYRADWLDNQKDRQLVNDLKLQIKNIVSKIKMD